MIFVIMMTEWAFWRTFALFIYLGSLLLLPGTLLLGREINGAYAWYQIGGFSFQPSEIAKFGNLPGHGRLFEFHRGQPARMAQPI